VEESCKTHVRDGSDQARCKEFQETRQQSPAAKPQISKCNDVVQQEIAGHRDESACGLSANECGAEAQVADTQHGQVEEQADESDKSKQNEPSRNDVPDDFVQE